LSLQNLLRACRTSTALPEVSRCLLKGRTSEASVGALPLADGDELRLL